MPKTSMPRHSLPRREFLKHASLTFIALGLPALPATARGLRHIGKPQRFDFATLKGQARALAARPWVDAGRPLPPAVAALNWDQHQQIRYKPEHALWRDGNGGFLAQFFHLGMYQHLPVRMFEVDAGMAHELAYDAAAFDYGSSGLTGRELPPNLGFAGFRINPRDNAGHDLAAFLGASYFRAVGRDKQYGLSARGLAIDTGMGKPEEFPVFVAWYLETPAEGSNTVVVYGLLDSPSIAGAYRFAITPGEPLLMDIDCALYPRTRIERLGIAPGTSMFQCGENDRRVGHDWRPEIHDSDGLQIHAGSGEWLWRPLENPPQLRFNMFMDEQPRGFGLLQRDRNFDHYGDDGVYYERRPSLWVEPKHDWGRGSVQLVEIPTVDETFDNIVAFWNPEVKPQAGQELLYGYRLYWGAQAPTQPPLAQCMATRTGGGGVIGKKREYFSGRFVVDFVGGELGSLLENGAPHVEPVLQVTHGRAEIVSARPQFQIGGYRAQFDIVPADESQQQIDIRLFLRHEDRTLSETWLYQWTPPPAAERNLY